MPYKLNLENPKTFNEKLQWLKLNWYNRKALICANKYLVRDYIKEKGLEYILNDLYQVEKDVNNIKWNSLPNRYVLKPTHDSGHVIKVLDKHQVNTKKVRKMLRRWLKYDYEYMSNEWQYSSLKLVVVEKFIEDPLLKNDITDYKFFCFNGKVKLIQIDFDRYTNHSRIYLNEFWEKYSMEHKNIKKNENNNIILPFNKEEMVQIAQKLSEDFPFVRIDLYNIIEKIIFGEMTFFPGGGYFPFLNNNDDLMIGELLELPKKVENPWKNVKRNKK